MDWFEMKDLEFLAGVLGEDERLHIVNVERDPNKKQELLFIAPALSEDNKMTIKNLTLLFYALENCPLKDGATKEEYLSELNQFCNGLDYHHDILDIKGGFIPKDRGYNLVLGAISNACQTLNSLGFDLPKEHSEYCFV